MLEASWSKLGSFFRLSAGERARERERDWRLMDDDREQKIDRES